MSSDNVVAEETSETEKTVSLRAFLEVKKEKQKYKEELEAFQLAEEERRNAELTETERLKKENEQLATTLRLKEIKEMKHNAYLEAKSQIGEGYIIDDEAKLYSAIEKLSFDEKSYKDDVFNIIELSKKPKTPAAQPIFNMGASQSGKKASEYSAAELRNLHDNDKVAYAEVMKQRKELKNRR